ncbi:hypothetical protein BCV72DRAFT_208115, partial [Rhizopus microsporus var. microsporus]
YIPLRANFELLGGEEGEKLEAISNICSSSQTQLHKIKGKYCEAIETAPIEETPSLLYLNKNRKFINPADPNSEKHKAEQYQYVQRFKSVESGRISWKKCFEQGYLDDIKVIKYF